VEKREGFWWMLLEDISMRKQEAGYLEAGYPACMIGLGSKPTSKLEVGRKLEKMEVTG
jgi:hypothetical protein